MKSLSGGAMAAAVVRLLVWWPCGAVVAQVQWTARSCPRSADAVAFDDARGRLVLFSAGVESPPQPETWEWDGLVWERRISGTSPPARTEHRLAYDLLRRRVVLFGGIVQGKTAADTWEWDGSNWQLRQPATQPWARSLHAMTYDLQRGRVVLFGGTAAGNRSFPMNDTWEWDGSNWQTMPSAVVPLGRKWSSMAYDLQRGRTVLFGGDATTVIGSPPPFGDTWEWDGVVWTPLQPPTSPSARAGHTMIYDLLRGRVLLSGGTANFDLWEWDGSTWIRRIPSSGSEPPVAAGMAFDTARGVTLQATGCDMWQWDGAQWTHSFEAGAPPGRNSAAVAYDPVGERVLVFGGFHSTVALGDFWEWDGLQWHELHPPLLPSPRGRGAMVFDSLRGRALLFGGDRPGFTNETWEWNGSTWQLLTTVGPTTRADFAFAYDSVRDRAVLFGGLSNQPAPPTPRADTWEWNGTLWLRRTPAVAPSARSAHAMVFDERRAVTVLFGGLGVAPGSTLNDTWEWDGVLWHQRSSAVAPGPRAEHALTYDRARQRVVLFGGIGLAGAGAVSLSDTWEWDGTQWTQRFPKTSPLARQRHGLAFDAARDRILLFGGHPALPDTWELTAVRPATLTAYGAGCATSAGPLRLETGGTRPWLGDTLALRLLPLPPAAPALLLLGSSRTTWNGSPLPRSLDAIGMPGCVLSASIDEVVFALGGGVADFPLAVPVQPGLLGAAVYLQAVAFDSAANAAGLATSNALAGVIGAR